MHNDPANQSREEFEHYENLVMQTELLEPETDTRLAPLRKQDVAIAKMAEEFMPLRVKDHTDERGVKAVHEARMVCVKTRTAVEKTRKELKADSLEYGRKVDAEAKRITAMIEPIEKHLEEQEAIVTREKERIKALAEAKRKAALDARISKLTAVGCVLNPSMIEVMSDEKFAEIIAEATQLKADKERAAAEKLAVEAAEKQRQAEEAARNRAELEAQRKQLEEERRKHEAEAAAERAKLEALRQEQERERKAAERRAEELQRERDQKAAEERAVLAAQQRKLDEERRAIEVENARREAAEKVRRETEERIAREAEAKRLAEEAEAARLARLEAERPHREQIAAIGRKLMEIDVPSGLLTERVESVLQTAAAEILRIAGDA